MSDLPSSDQPKDKQKKPRHRHSPTQLAALNELFEQDERPPPNLRASLAERLGMEKKTVNAWFQNKRASSKKKTRGPTNIASSINPSTSNNNITHDPSEFDDYHDDDYTPIHYQPSLASSTGTSLTSEPRSSFYPPHLDHPYYHSEADSMPRRMRMRPSTEQIEELKLLYTITPHPTTEQRQLLAKRIGMRYQSVTNWFQNQRSIAKKRKEDETNVPSSTSSLTDYHDGRLYSAFPPPPNHPSLGLPMSGHSSAPVSSAPRSPSISPSLDGFSTRRSSSRRSATPYSTSPRQRRSRPEPYQLDALKDLFIKTPAPSIEERSALASEIGMDVGKVTNWFRNLRQTARRRYNHKRSGSAEDEDYDLFHHQLYLVSASRSGSPPSFRSYSSSPSMELNGDDDYDMRENTHSDVGSEDEYQEAVTPPPVPSPRLTPAAAAAAAAAVESTTASSSRIAISELTLSIDPASYAELEKVSATQFSGIKIEDALLLLSFHRHVVH